MKKYFIPLVLLLGACAEGDLPAVSDLNSDNIRGAAREYFAKFSLESAQITEFQRSNLCPQLGGTGAAPDLKILHSPQAGFDITVRMYDQHNDGTVTEHNTLTVVSEADGETSVPASGFRLPCNTTGGKRNSLYKFDIDTRNSGIDLTWGGYNSATDTIE